MNVEKKLYHAQSQLDIALDNMKTARAELAIANANYNKDVKEAVEQANHFQSLLVSKEIQLPKRSKPFNKVLRRQFNFGINKPIPTSLH